MSSIIEGSIPPEVLQERGKSIISGFKRMLDNGLELEVLRKSQREYRTQLEDWFLLKLGLQKSAATLLDPFVELFSTQYGLRDNYLSLADDGREDRILIDRGSAWNPRSVGKVLTQNTALIEELKTHGLMGQWLEMGPENPDFGSFLAFVNSQFAPPKAMIMTGLLNGYPSLDVYPFVRYHQDILTGSDALWTFAQQHGIKDLPPKPLNIRQLVGNQLGERDAYMILADTVGLADLKIVPEGLVDYVRTLRFAKVPGTPYVTSRVDTAEERNLRNAYKISEVGKLFQELVEN